MKKIAIIATYSTYVFFFLGSLADTGKSNTLRYITHSEELLHALHQLYLQKTVYIPARYLNQPIITLLRYAPHNPAHALLIHAEQVLYTLNTVITAKHYHQAQICQSFDKWNASYQTVHNMHIQALSIHEKEHYKKQLVTIQKEMKKHQNLMKAMNWKLLTIGILLDQWVQRATTMLSPHLLSEWLGYCSVTLAPESFSELIHYCAQSYANEIETTTNRASKIENYQQYLYMTMKKPKTESNSTHSSKYVGALVPNKRTYAQANLDRHLLTHSKSPYLDYKKKRNT